LFSLQFPLSKIHLGCLNIEVDDIHIVLSIEANDAATTPLSNMEELVLFVVYVLNFEYILNKPHFASSFCRTLFLCERYYILIKMQKRTRNHLLGLVAI
jgi:hypothetical protein